jgi:diketogulonate reductase-like aldo/keto reductase
MPLLGLGTFLSKSGEVGLAVKAALQVGYRHIDCAEDYGNQKEIGQALSEVFAEGKILRKDVFITSKLKASFTHPDQINNQINTTLSDLQLTYLDLYLIHQPVPTIMKESSPNKNYQIAARGISIEQVWRKLEEIHDSGKAKSIGVSNFPTVLVNDLINYARIKPVINQIELTPYLTQKRHVAFCRSLGIEITAYGALGAPGLMNNKRAEPILSNPVVLSLAVKKRKTPAQILIRYHIDQKVTVIPKSAKKERIEENWNVWDFELNAEELKALDDLNMDLRLFGQDWHGVPTFT